MQIQKEQVIMHIHNTFASLAIPVARLNVSLTPNSEARIPEIGKEGLKKCGRILALTSGQSYIELRVPGWRP
jgi:hypothetical protein